MIKDNLRELLDKIYELEGLVHLALRREDSYEEFLHLIIKKGDAVSVLCKELINDNSEGKEKTTIPENEDNYLPSETTFSLDEYTINEDNSDEETLKADYNEPISEIKQGYNPLKSSLDNDSTHQQGKLVFTINERFRFKKSLFNNSDIDFNNTLALMASMEDYEEAENYFINEEGFDASDTIVKEFLEVVKRYFK